MIHICFSLHDETGLDSKFTGTAMLSLFENVSKPAPSITVHILHDNTLTPDNRNKFNYLAGRHGQVLKFYNVEELCAEKIEKMSRILTKVKETSLNNESIYKFFIPQVLPTDLQKVIYLDSNIVVNLDINELWKIDLEDKMLGIVPALAIGSDIHIQDKVVTDGFVQSENYFNSGVLLMNLKLLRGEEETVEKGLKFANNRSYFNFLEQVVFNYCFSTRILKLPEEFNQFVRWARRNKEPLLKKIYHYTGDSLQMDKNDPFNQLWLEYFSKTPWLDLETLGRIYESFRQSYGQLNNKMKNGMVNLTVFTAGKKRAFFTLPQNAEATKEIFSVRADEEIIVGEDQESLKKLINAMKKSQGKKIFFILVPRFPYSVLNKAGFTFGKDFLNGMELIPADNEPILNSYPIIKAM